MEPHRERSREYAKKAQKAKKRRRGPKFTNCGVCGCLLRKNGNVKYCRPCSVDRNGAWHHRHSRKQRTEEGTCVDCGKAPSVKDRTRCKECSRKTTAIEISAYNERKAHGICTECGKVPRGKTQFCEKCRRDQKLRKIRRAMRKGWRLLLPVRDPLDYLYEGHRYVMAGCLLLEEIETPLEAEELEEIKKLLDPYAERIGEFWLNVGVQKCSILRGVRGESASRPGVMGLLSLEGILRASFG